MCVICVGTYGSVMSVMLFERRDRLAYLLCAVGHQRPGGPAVHYLLVLLNYNGEMAEDTIASRNSFILPLLFCSLLSEALCIVFRDTHVWTFGQKLEEQHILYAPKL